MAECLKESGVHESRPPSPIAIVGISMRLPGGIDNETKFWDFLVNKKDAKSFVPKNRYKGHGTAGFLDLTQGYFLQDVDLTEMDSGFFSMSKAEADQLDPHHRLLLEVVYEAFESAGETGWRGRDIGCYVGFSAEDWNDLQAKDPQDFPMHRMTGSFDFALANRISYEYDLRGPSFVTKAACCSLALSFHLACEAVSHGQCSSAVVCGANLVLTPVMTMALFEAGALSADVSCKTFDASANGYARADAVNAVYIKRLDDAIRDGNPIRAVIRSTVVNFDGRTSGISNPSTSAQETLMREAYRQAGLDAAETAFCECHGTGTAAGDPIEAMAVANVWGKRGGILIGSVKPNVGHSGAASGLTSVIKAVLSLENKVIVPNIKFHTPNPKIPWGSASLAVPTELTPWPEGRKERISINNFGFGGTNCHIILDSAESYLSSYMPQMFHHGDQLTGHVDTNGIRGAHDTNDIPATDGASGARAVNYVGDNASQNTNLSLLVFSANHEESLAATIRNMKEFYAQTRPSLQDLAHTLGSRREHLPYRTFAITDPSRPFDVNTANMKAATIGLKPVFIFTGQGAQWPGMGKELMVAYPSFLRDIRAMDSHLAGLKQPPSFSMEDELQKPATTSLLDKFQYSQPIFVAVQVALVNLLRSWGVTPAGVVGHSSGDISAAYAAGVHTMEESITVAYYRGVALKARTLGGGMAAIGLGAEEVGQLLSDALSIACVNSGTSVTISGDGRLLDQFIENLKTDRPEVFARRLHVEMAYHSHHMQDVGGPYQQLLEGHLDPKAPAITYYSTVRGIFMTDQDEFGPSYWVANLASPVLFHSGVKALLSLPQLQGSPHVEIGPHSALAGPLKQIYKEVDIKPQYLSLLTRNEDARKSILEAAGKLFCAGVDLNFAAINPKGITLPKLPNYPWHREGGFWHESRVTKSWRLKPFAHHDILGSRVAEASDLEPVWRNLMHPNTMPAWIRDYVIRSETIFPTAAYIAMVGEAVSQISGNRDYTVRNVTINIASPLVVRGNESLELITSLRPYKLTTTAESAWFDFSIISNSSTGWINICHGQVRSGAASEYITSEPPPLLRRISSRRWYKAWRRLGLEYGPSFHGLQDIVVGVDQKVASATVVEGLTESEPSYQLHPTSLTMVIQAIDAAMYHGQTRAIHTAFQPKYIEELYVGAGAGKQIHINIVARTSPGNVVTGYGYGVNQSNKLAVFFEGVTLSALDVEGDNRGDNPHGAVQLEWKPDIDLIDLGALARPKILMESAVTMIEKLFLLCAIENQAQIQGHIAVGGHLNKFCNWLQELIESARENKSRVVSATSKLCELSSSERQEMIQEMMDQARDTPTMAAYRPIYAIYEAAVDIIAGEVDALELLFRDDMLTDFYNFFTWIDFVDLVQLLGHENPKLRVLEIGAGTGSYTEIFLKSLKNSAGKRLYSKYFYTDISAGFFVKAKERFIDYPGIEYRTFDVTKAPGEQGLEEDTFDVVVAGNVLHATPVLKDTLTDVRKLLRPRGRLLLFETCPESDFINYVAGILPGWWLGEADGRPKRPYVLPERWDQELRKAGFEGIESVCYDQKPPYQQNAMMIARAAVVVDVKMSIHTQPKRVTMLAPPDAGLNTAALEDYLRNQGFQVDRCSLEHTKPLSIAGHKIISVYELESPFLYDMQEAQFRALVDFVCSLEPGQSLLWLTRAAQIAATDPRYGLINGMARTIRSELNVKLGILELDTLDERAWEATLKVCTKLCHSGGDFEETDPDYEFALQDGIVHISRFVDVSVTDGLAMIGVEGSPRHLQIAKKGALDTLRWAATAPQENALDAADVDVDVRVAGLNNRDIFVAMGIIDGDDFGYECAGVVHAVGIEVSGVKVGDHVMVLGERALCSRVRTSSHRCIKMPPGLSFEEAATMPSIYGTVIRGLLGVGHLMREQTVLVQAAAAPAGVAALHICKAIGAEVYATTDSPEKAIFLIETFGIAQDRIFSSTDQSFLAGVMKATQGRGVDLVLNSLAGELLHASWQCVAENGIMVELGKRDITGRGKLALDLFNDNRGFFGVDIARLCNSRPWEAKNMLATLVAMYEASEIKPFQPIMTFDARNASEAFQFLQKRDHNGKVAIRMPEDVDSLPGVAVLGQRDIFRSDVSYLLVGGVGGLGQAVATWMVERGARNLMFFSRSAANRATHGAFFDQLEASGCFAQAFSGNAANFDDVKRAVSDAAKPVAGVMQMSLILRDQSLPNMTMDEWNDVIRPKVQGTWNLHEALGHHNLDFFVMFSSMCGLAGHFGQANYAAANTFLDAFTQYRQHLGLPASVIDIGVMEDVGSLTSTNPGALEPLRASAYWMLIERDLLESLELMICGGFPSSTEPPQSLTNDTAAAIMRGYTSRGQLGIGIRSTLPLCDPRNRVVWRRDRRMAVYWNDGGAGAADGGVSSSKNTGLSRFLTSVANDPTVLNNAEETAQTLTREIGRYLNDILGAAKDEDEDEQQLDPRMGLVELGVDSLIIIGLRNWLRQNLGVEVAVPEIVECVSVAELGRLAASRLKDKYDTALGGKQKSSA